MANKTLVATFCRLLRPQTRHFRTCTPFHKKMDQQKFMKETQLKQIRDTELMAKELFEDFDEKQKNKENFKGALEIFKNRDVRRRGAVEFIRAALKNMKAYGVERDLEVYKALVDVLPKGVYIPQNVIQAGFFHYPKQQECLVDVLVQMSEYKCYPDKELGKLLENICGMDSAPYR